MPPKSTGIDDWANFLLVCLQNIQDANGNLIQPNWQAVADATGSKAHTLYCRYNTHVMKPLGLKSAKKSKIAGGGASTVGRKRKSAVSTEKGPTGSDEEEDDAKSAGAKKARKITWEETKRREEKIAKMSNGKGKFKREDSSDDGQERKELRSSDVDGEFEYEDDANSKACGV